MLRVAGAQRARASDNPDSNFSHLSRLKLSDERPYQARGHGFAGFVRFSSQFPVERRFSYVRAE